MAVEPKIDPIGLSIVKVVAVTFGPDDIEAPAGTVSKSIVDGDVQFEVRIESRAQLLMGDQRLVFEEDIPDPLEGFVVDRSRVPGEIRHSQATTFRAS
jgi:hypothetical protein